MTTRSNRPPPARTRLLAPLALRRLVVGLVVADRRGDALLQRLHARPNSNEKYFSTKRQISALSTGTAASLACTSAEAPRPVSLLRVTN